MTIKTCFNCQYYRDPVMLPGMDYYWCSNSKSINVYKAVLRNGSCPEFVKKGRKANIGMQIAKVLLRKVK